MRFGDFLRTAVLLFAGAATACAVVAIAGAKANDDTSLLYVAVAWWAIATVIGLWLGRGAHAIEGISRLLADARSSQTLPEVEPGRVLFNRMWALALATIATGGLAWFLPPGPAIGARFFLPGGPGVRARFLPARGPRVPPPAVSGAGDRGARRRALLRRAHLAVRADE